MGLFVQRKKMTDAWSPGRLEWMFNNLVIVLLFCGASLPESISVPSLVSQEIEPILIKEPHVLLHC